MLSTTCLKINSLDPICEKSTQRYLAIPFLFLFISMTLAFRRFSLRPIKVTLTPSAANDRAIPLPRPLLEAITRPVLPAIPVSIIKPNLSD